MNAMLSADASFLEWRALPSRETLRRLLQANQDRVYSLCHQVLRHVQDAEDAAQASLIEIARGLQKVENPAAFSSWMYRVCLNNSLTLLRERRRRKNREERRAAMIPATDASTADELRDAVHEALARLDDDERALVIEHYFEKSTLEDMGTRRGISGVAAWKRIEHAKERMKRALAGAGFASGASRLDSVLDAAEPVAAPSGLSVEAALTRTIPGTASAIRFVALLAALGVVVFISAALILPRSGNVPVAANKNHPAPSPLPDPPSNSPVPSPDMPVRPAVPPIQEESSRLFDRDGNPIQGALVFPGRWYRLRGDDAFDQFRPKSIKDGVVTDAEGRFRLESKSPFVTAWHDDFTPTTVAASDASVIRMKSRATLRSKLVDSAGKPQEGVEITLDKRGPKAITDSEGSFKFEKVIAGVRGLILPNNRRIALRIEAGETLDLEIGPGVDVTLDLGGRPADADPEINGMILGTGRMSSLVGVRGRPPSVDLKGILPGRYFYGEIRRGPRGWVDISEKGARVDFGSSTLEVTGAAPLSFYIFPADVNEVLEVAIMKDGPFKVSPEAPEKLSHLTEGDYEIRDLEGVTLQKFKVGPGENRITVKAR
jgi:RNA polymerase sigma factor (sigma-70 family)